MPSGSTSLQEPKARPRSPFGAMIEKDPDMGVSENLGTLYWGPYNKDPTIWGTILGPPIFGNSHMGLIYKPATTFGILILAIVVLLYHTLKPSLSIAGPITI